MGLGPYGMDREREDDLIAFCFPGQGSLEEGMGREIATAVPEAMEIYRTPSEVPSRFSGAGSGCGVILIWRRTGR